MPRSNDLTPTAVNNQSSVDLNKHFDYIVCGSGSSGSVVAGKLVANTMAPCVIVGERAAEVLQTLHRTK